MGNISTENKTKNKLKNNLLNRLINLVTRRHEMFWENKLGWKDDLRNLLDEIYDFTTVDNRPLPLKYLPSVPKIETYSDTEKFIISHTDIDTSTVLMKKA